MYEVEWEKSVLTLSHSFMKIASQASSMRERCDSQPGATGGSLPGSARQGQNQNQNQNSTTRQNSNSQYQTTEPDSASGSPCRTNGTSVGCFCSFQKAWQLGSRRKAIWATRNAGLQSCCGTLHKTRSRKSSSLTTVFHMSACPPV